MRGDGGHAVEARIVGRGERGGGVYGGGVGGVNIRGGRSFVISGVGGEVMRGLRVHIASIIIRVGGERFMRRVESVL